MLKKILVPLDGSKFSLKELEFAKEIGMKFSSTLFITTIIDPTIEAPAFFKVSFCSFRDCPAVETRA